MSNNKHEVTYVFGRRSEQEGLPGYESGAYDPFVFTVLVDSVPSSWDSAYVLLAYFEDDFVRACRAAETSTIDNLIKGRTIWIPTGYLDRPTIEVDGKELLLNGVPPNPWLSLKK